MSLVELVAFPVVFCLGFVLGVFIGVRVQHHRLTREVHVQARTIKKWWDRWATTLVGVFMIVMAVLIGNSQLQHDSDQRDLQRQSACVTQYANRLYESLRPRQAASEALQRADQSFNDALVALLKVALSPHPSHVQAHRDAVRLAAAAQHKQRVAEHLSRERNQNPYPSPPKKVCPK